MPAYRIKKTWEYTEIVEVNAPNPDIAKVMACVTIGTRNNDDQLQTCKLLCNCEGNPCPNCKHDGFYCDDCIHGNFYPSNNECKFEKSIMQSGD